MAHRSAVTVVEFRCSDCGSLVGGEHDCTPAPKHPAKWSEPILDVIRAHVEAEREAVGRDLVVLDPFCGVGMPRLANALGEQTTLVGVELEPEWAIGGAVVANAVALPCRPASVDVLATSPAYGNRMADAHNAVERCRSCAGDGFVREQRAPDYPRKPCEKCAGTGRRDYVRNTYRHTLGRKPSDGSAAVLRWGPKYRRLHEAAWRAANDALRPGALVLVNVKNHTETYDDGEIEHPVTEWHLNFWLSLDAKLLTVVEIDTPGQRHGANRDARADCERLLVLRSRSVSWRR